MIDLRLKPEFFNRYNFSHHDKVRFGIDVSELKSRICEARKGDTIALLLTEDPGFSEQEHQVQMAVDETGIQSRFTIEPYTLDEEDVPDTDDIQFSGNAILSLDKLKDAIQRMGDSAELTLQSDRLTVKSETENGEASGEFLDGSDYIHVIQLANGPVSPTHSTDYLEQVTKLKNTVKRVKLRFGNDFPLRVEVDRDQFRLEYTLAPRIEG